MQLLSEYGINTVCQQARCPNLQQCFLGGKLTFLILGDTCTRDCRFCAVKKSKAGADLAEDEPGRIAELVKLLALKFVVITSVTRDDLLDGGAGQFAETIKTIQALDSGVKVEVLIPDFKGKPHSLETVLAARPDVLAHNIETVERIYPQIRPQADYRFSLGVLSRAGEIDKSVITKSSLMLGIGEKEIELIQAMQDLRRAQCDILTLGQYLAPSKRHYPVKEFISPRQFARYRSIGLGLGFRSVSSGPLVRSSYQAEQVYAEDVQCMS